MSEGMFSQVAVHLNLCHFLYSGITCWDIAQLTEELTLISFFP